MTDSYEETTRQFERDGFVILEDRIDAADIEQVLRIWWADPQLTAALKENANFDGDDGIRTRLAYRQDLGDDAYGALARSARVVEPMEHIYQSTIQHYYTLNMQKDPGTGGNITRTTAITIASSSTPIS